MRAEELDNLTEEQLQQEANRCFIAAEGTNIFQQGGETERLRLHLEAQFYLTALARRRDERVAERDFLLERGVIWLIGVEIVLSIVFGGIGIWEGYQQGRVLENVKESTAASASAMNVASKSLTALTADQEKSLNRLKEMNDKLQASLTTTGTMASAEAASVDRLKQMNGTLQSSLTQANAMASTLQSQLGILQQQQANAQAELAKKPRLELRWNGDVNINRNGLRPYDFTPSAETDTSATFDLVFSNAGTAPATRIELAIGAQVGANRRVSIESQLPLKKPLVTYNYGVLEFEYLRPRAQVHIPLTFTFTKGTEPFGVQFSVSADQIEADTNLGTITVTPRKPQAP